MLKILNINWNGLTDLGIYDRITEESLNLCVRSKQSNLSKKKNNNNSK